MDTAVSFAPKEVMARKDLDLRTGDTVRVYVKIEERGKTRIQMFEGLVIATKHGREAGATFTVRKISNGVGIERIFPLYSPSIDKIEVVKRARVRQAKLYYIRDKVAREIRRKMRNLVAFTATTEDLVPVEEMMDETEEALAKEVATTEETPVVAEESKEAAADEEVSEEETTMEQAPTEETAEEEKPAAPAEEEAKE